MTYGCPRFLPRSNHLCVPAYPAWGGSLQGRDGRPRHEHAVQRRQGGEAVAAQIGAGDRRQLEAAVGGEALLQSRAVRRGPEADRRLLPRPRVSRRADLVVRRQAEPRSELGGHRARHLGRRAGHRRACRPSGLRDPARRPLPGPGGAAAVEAGAAAGSGAAAGHPRGGARRAERPRLSVCDRCGSPRKPAPGSAGGR